MTDVWQKTCFQYWELKPKSNFGISIKPEIFLPKQKVSGILGFDLTLTANYMQPLVQVQTILLKYSANILAQILSLIYCASICGAQILWLNYFSGSNFIQEPNIPGQIENAEPLAND